MAISTSSTAVPRPAFLFPGQGSQVVGMGKDLYENSKAARKVFDQVDRALGEPLTELMFQGIVVNLVAFGRYPLSGTPTLDGQVFALFLLAVAAAEAALALALVVLLFRRSESLDAEGWSEMRG